MIKIIYIVLIIMGLFILFGKKTNRKNPSSSNKDNNIKDADFEIIDDKD